MFSVHKSSSRGLRMRIVNVIDIGSSKIACATVSSDHSGALVVHGAGICSYGGFKPGSLPSDRSLSDAIAQAIDFARYDSGIAVRSVSIGIPAPFVDIRTIPCSVGSKSPVRISQADIDYLLECSASSCVRDKAFELIHSTPFSFRLDDEELNAASPCGFSARKLSANVSHVYADREFLAMLRSITERLGIDVNLFVLQTAADAVFTIPVDDRHSGAVLFDCGGNHCDVSLILDDAVVDSVTVCMGGNDITNDIAFGLRLPYENAEALKFNFNFAEERNGCVRTKTKHEGIVSVENALVRKIILSRTDKLGNGFLKALRLMNLDSTDLPIYMTGCGIAKLAGGREYFSEYVGKKLIINAPYFPGDDCLDYASCFALSQFMLYGSGASLKVPNRLSKTIKSIITTKL